MSYMSLFHLKLLLSYFCNHNVFLLRVSHTFWNVTLPYCYSNFFLSCFPTDATLPYVQPHINIKNNQLYEQENNYNQITSTQNIILLHGQSIWHRLLATLRNKRLHHTCCDLQEVSTHLYKWKGCLEAATTHGILSFQGSLGCKWHQKLSSQNKKHQGIIKWCNYRN